MAFKYRSAIGILLYEESSQDPSPSELWNLWLISEKSIQKKFKGNHVRSKRNKLITHVQSLFIWAFYYFITQLLHTQKTASFASSYRSLINFCLMKHKCVCASLLGAWSSWVFVQHWPEWLCPSNTNVCMPFKALWQGLFWACQLPWSPVCWFAMKIESHAHYVQNYIGGWREHVCF